MSNEIRITTKESIGLGNVDNTSDADKPVSTAQQTAFDLKLDLAGGTMSGDLEFSGAAALEIADDAYVFKSKSDNDVGIVYNITDKSLDNKSTAGAVHSKVYVETGIYRLGGKFVAADFVKTADTALAAVPGLSLTLRAGTNYKFSAILFYACDSTGGIKWLVTGINGLTATNILFENNCLNHSTDVYDLGNVVADLSSISQLVSLTRGTIRLEGLIEVNAGGDLIVQFAQSVANNLSRILRGSTFTIEEMA